MNPRNPEAPPSIQAFCVPIVYLDRDALDLVKDGYGVTVTTVVVKPRSRGEVRLASADPSEMPMVSPNLLKDPADMQEMVEGQRFFLSAFEQKPLADRLQPNCDPGARRPLRCGVAGPLQAVRQNQLPSRGHGKDRR